MRSSVRSVACVASLVWALLCVSVSVAWAQGGRPEAPGEVSLVGMESLPGRAERLVATPTGDVFLLEPVAAQRRNRPMTRLVASSGFYNVDPMVFGNPAWAEFKIDDISQSSDQTIWAVSQDSVLYQRAGEPWEQVQLPLLSRSLCVGWSEFGVACQLVVPVADERAVVLRPVQRSGALGTEVFAIEQGELRPLGSVVLPGVALGPAVQDGEGGFWVMLRRTVQTSNFKPMRGYLHYTADGQWQMWSDSGEQVEGTQLMGAVKFLVDPNARKMAQDGAGGFVALGRDRILYHVKADGRAERFSASQPTCQYCQPLSITYDDVSGTVNMLMGEWFEGEAGQVEVLGPTRWLEFEGKTGALLRDEVVPLPASALSRARELYDQVVISSSMGSRWISGPKVLMHGERGRWSVLAGLEEAKQQQLVLVEQEREAARRPQRAALASVGQVGLIAAGVLGTTGLFASRSSALGLTGDDVFTYGVGLPMLGAMVGWYPAMYSMPFMSEDYDGELNRRACLSAGMATMTVATGAGTWLMGEALARPRRAAATGNQQSSFDPGALAASMGGAAVGTLAGLALSQVIFRHRATPPEGVMHALILSMVSASLASVAYMAVSPSWR